MINQIIQGDCIEQLKLLPENSIDAIITDPPYGLGFMGKEWDTMDSSQFGIMGNEGENDLKVKKNFKILPRIAEGGALQKFSESWARECLRVLKHGGYLLSFGGTRTYHRMTCGIEDAGFEIRDCIMWIYGSGFPKSLNIGKQIDKINGKKQEDFIALGNYLKEQRLKLNFPQIEISKHFPSKTGGITGCVSNWELGMNVPTKEQWVILKDKLQLDNKFDWIIEREEAEREVVGKHTTDMGGLGGERLGNKGGNITISATEQAKEWEGWGTALKPAHEPIVVARKPLSEKNVALNVLKWGTGGINIDESRIGTDELTGRNNKIGSNIYGGGKGFPPVQVEGNTIGRFPANIIFEKSYQQIYTLKESFINLIPLLNLYYGNEYMLKLQGEISNLQEQNKGQSWKVLQEEMLSSLDEGKEKSNGWEKTQQEINPEDDRKQEEYSKRKGQQEIQRVLDEQRIQTPQSPRINLQSTEISKADDNKTRDSRTQDSNGYTSQQTSKEMGDSSSQKWSKERQQNREFGNDGQFNSQERTQRDIKRVKAITKGERGFIVCDCDLPKEWRNFFEPTIIEIDYPFSSAKMLDEQSGILGSNSLAIRRNDSSGGTGNVYVTSNDIKGNVVSILGKGGASRFFYVAKASKSERNFGCEELEYKELPHSPYDRCNNCGKYYPTVFTQSKEICSCENPIRVGNKLKNNHPTIKPIKLMEYLIKLVSREGATILDPFIGSGTTAIACIKTNRNFIGIEKEPDYIKIAEARIKPYLEQTKL